MVFLSGFNQSTYLHTPYENEIQKRNIVSKKQKKKNQKEKNENMLRGPKTTNKRHGRQEQGIFAVTIQLETILSEMATC